MTEKRIEYDMLKKKEGAISQEIQVDMRKSQLN